MTTAARPRIIGEPIDRVDGPLKVTGAAAYPSDFAFPDLAHAVLVQSTIAAGRITAIDAAKAQAAPGVLAVITHENGPALVDGPTDRTLAHARARLPTALPAPSTRVCAIG